MEEKIHSMKDGVFSSLLIHSCLGSWKKRGKWLPFFPPLSQFFSLVIELAMNLVLSRKRLGSSKLIDDSETLVIAQIHDTSDGSVIQKLIPLCDWDEAHLDFIRKYEWADENVDERKTYREVNRFIRSHKAVQLSNNAFPLRIAMVYLDIWDGREN